MKDIPPIMAVMTAFPHWVDIEIPLAEARKVMLKHEIHHLPVMEQGKLVSVLTTREIERSRDRGKLASHRVRDACVRGTYVVGLSAPLDDVLQHMAEHHLDAALVVKDSKLAGIFTTSDACRCFARHLRSLFPHGGDPDAA